MPDDIQTFAGGQVIATPTETLLVLVRNDTVRNLEFWRLDANDPIVVPTQRQGYAFADRSQHAIALDCQRGTWLLYSLLADGSAIELRSAPVSYL